MTSARARDADRRRSAQGRRRDALHRALALKLELTARLSAGRAGLVLLYHRVGDPPGDPLRELVPALGLADFRAQLRHLRQRYRVVPAASILHAVRARRRGERFPVAITFDDDLETHWDVAAKLLREQGIPATFFLSGSFLSRPKPFWWEDLQRAVDEGTVEHHHLPELRPEELDDALLRKPGAIHKLAARFEQLEPARKRVVAGRLERLRSEPAGPAISVADVRALARDGFEIGFHTRDHEFLPNLTASEVQSGLVEGRDGLEAAAERPVDLLAYPHGGADRRVADAVRRAGYRGAYTVRAEPVLPTSGAHLLPRWEPPFRSDGTFRLALAQTLFLGPRP